MFVNDQLSERLGWAWNTAMAEAYSNFDEMAALKYIAELNLLGSPFTEYLDR